MAPGQLIFVAISAKAYSKQLAIRNIDASEAQTPIEVGPEDMAHIMSQSNPEQYLSEITGSAKRVMYGHQRYSKAHGTITHLS